jgi:pimeloyl-ACP methyl ester carboxylesterase
MSATKLDAIEIPKVVIFIVGLGAPASLYSDYLSDLKKQLSQIKIFVLEWWNQDDFGFSELRSYIGNSSVTLVCHSAGGSIGLQAFAKWPNLVKKMIMLDSHFLRSKTTLLTVNRMLDIILNNDHVIINNKVKSAYAPIVDNSLFFNKALNFAVEWVNTSFDQTCALFNMMPDHSGLFIGFSNTHYQMLNAEDKKALYEIWEKFNVDVKFLPMNHFDLIDVKYAIMINQLIADWLGEFPH